MGNGNWYAKLSHATVNRFCYNIVFCKAVAFMTALLFSHSFVDKGVVGILISYVEEKWKNVNLAKVASIMNVQDGLSAVMMILISHASDTWTGRFMMVVCSTFAYVIGFWLLYVSAKLKSTKNVVLFFYLAMVPIAAGKAVTDPTLLAFLGDQMEKQEEPNQPIDEERVQARVKFWSRLNKFLGATAALLVFGKLQEWSDSFRISAIVMSISGFLFLCGFPWYHPKNPTGSPITDVYFVTMAAIRKRHLQYPATSKQFYHNHKDEPQLSPHVAILRWLDKAAIIEEKSNSMSPEEQERKGMLCPVTQVKKVKLLSTMAPMWTTFLIYCLVVATGSTFFLLQTSNMDGNVPLILIYFSMIRSFSSFVVSFLYELLVPKLWTETQQKRAWKVRIGIGMFCSFLSCIVARFVETHRLKLYKEGNYLRIEEDGVEIVPMSVFWLTPQFCLLGFMEGLCEDGLVDFYHHHVPESMKSYGPPFNQWVLGMGNFLSILWILTFKPWFGDDINKSQLDNYYAILAIVSLGNQFIYRYVSNMPIYNIVEVAENGEKPLEILIENEDPVSKSVTPPSHTGIPTTGIPTTTQKIAASGSFPERQSSSGRATIRSDSLIRRLKFNHQ